MTTDAVCAPLNLKPYSLQYTVNYSLHCELQLQWPQGCLHIQSADLNTRQPQCYRHAGQGLPTLKA